MKAGPKHSRLCSGSSEIHTVHLPHRRGHYQVVYRCGCGANKRVGRVYSSLTRAELAIRNCSVEQLLSRRR